MFFHQFRIGFSCSVQGFGCGKLVIEMRSFNHIRILVSFRMGYFGSVSNRIGLIQIKHSYYLFDNNDQTKYVS